MWRPELSEVTTQEQRERSIDFTNPSLPTGRKQILQRTFSIQLMPEQVDCDSNKTGPVNGVSGNNRTDTIQPSCYHVTSSLSTQQLMPQ